MTNLSKKVNTNHQLTVRSFKFFKGLAIALFIIASPYLFYLYKSIPPETQVWETPFFTIKASGFYDVSFFLHALFTKIALVFLTSIAFLKILDWWKWSLLIPLVMFLYQLYGVLNQNWVVFDEYSFWYSLIPTVPIVGVLIFRAIKIKTNVENLDLIDIINEEIEAVKNE